MNRFLKTWLLVALSAFAPAVTAQEGTFVLEGDLSAHYASGNFVVWTSKPAAETGDGAAVTMGAASTATAAAAPAASTATATSGAAMTAASTATSSGSAPSSMEASLNVIARAPLGADGTFRVEAAVDAPREAYFYVLEARGHEGMRMAPMKGNEFILEPGNLRLNMTRPGRFTIEGGMYNDAVFNSWRRSDEYIAAEAEYLRLIPSVEGETEDERRARVDGSSAAFNRMLGFETEGRARVSTTHPDPLVRRLVIETAWLGGPWMLDAWRGLAEMTPDDPWVIDRLARAEVAEAKRVEERRRFAVGADIQDFVADTLDGESIRLADVRADSELVLVEFWASWCGPCRVEIPHMKQAYAKYGDQGFEILSFTVDDDRLDWEIASEEEDLPWFDTGMGMEHAVALAYGVTGVPKNYLVESGSGNIVAKDLRGHHLDIALEEFFQ